MFSLLGVFSESVDAAEILSHHPEWSDVPAIVNEAVFAIDPDLLLRPGPRLVEGTLQILTILHPRIAKTLR